MGGGHNEIGHILYQANGFDIVIVDDKEKAIGIEVITFSDSINLVRLRNRLLPQMIRVDNGPEFISFQLDQWCKKHGITLVFIQPGKPMQNGYVERCNGSIRSELLNAYIFTTLSEVRQKAAEWMDDYNRYRPHSSLGHLSPMDFKTKQALHSSGAEYHSDTDDQRTIAEMVLSSR